MQSFRKSTTFYMYPKVKHVQLPDTCRKSSIFDSGYRRRASDSGDMSPIHVQLFGYNRHAERSVHTGAACRMSTCRQCWRAVKFTNFFAVERLRNCSLWLSIAWFFPEVIAIEVQRCSKSRRIFDVFCPPNFYWYNFWKGPPFQKLYPYSHTCLAAHHVEKFCEVTPPGPKVTSAYTLNF